MNAIFHPKARLTRITPEGIEHFDLENFKAMALEMLNTGVYTSFVESEIARRQHVFGSVAHVLSAYEVRRNIEAKACLARGVNSIQLLWSGFAWQVLSLLWDEETESNRLNVASMFSPENAIAKSRQVPNLGHPKQRHCVSHDGGCGVQGHHAAHGWTIRGPTHRAGRPHAAQFRHMQLHGFGQALGAS